MTSSRRVLAQGLGSTKKGRNRPEQGTEEQGCLPPQPLGLLVPPGIGHPHHHHRQAPPRVMGPGLQSSQNVTGNLRSWTPQESGRCGLSRTPPRLTLPGCRPVFWPLPTAGEPWCPALSPVRLGSFAHHFPPPQLSGPGLLTRTLTSLGFVWEFF